MDETPTPPKRLQSLDALRGFDMLFITGGNTIVKGLALLTGWTWLGEQMNHVAWHGFAAYDMIFPLFLFIAGVSFPFSLNKYRQNNISNKKMHLNILRRAALLVLFGLIYNGLLNFQNIRVASVLGRIGIAWMFAALIFTHTKSLYSRILWVAGILIAYWAALNFFSAPDVNSLVINDSLRVKVPDYVLTETGNYSLLGSFAGYVDRLLLPGRMWLEVTDPEGILSTIPAIATALLGMLTGWFIQSHSNIWKGAKIAMYMFAAGLVLLLTGWLWGFNMPINKSLWTSSFVCYVGGWSLLLLALFYYIIDVLNYKKWAFFFVVIGLNSITIYMASAIVNVGFTSKFIFDGTINLFPENWQMMLSGIAYVAVIWCFLYFLYRQKIFLKV